MEPPMDADERRLKAQRATRGVLPASYGQFLADIRERVRTAQIKAAVSVNRDLIRLYWDIGKRIVERQEQEGWGEAVIERLAADLHRAFPEMGGFSARNLWRMRAFYRAYSGRAAILPQPVAEIPWGHNIIILEKVKPPRERIWYARKALEHGWARSILDLQIETDLYHRQGKVDFEKLRATLGEIVDERPERYSFTWAGKRDCIRLLSTASRRHG
jgi:predicted nuclease of restriction endonuclease-like (RecB) superfamily